MTGRIGTPEIYDDLKVKLTTAVFEPGAKLRPAALQRDYGCSANTVREILLLLSKDGLVTFELQRGFRAMEASLERRSDVTRFRVLLEQEGTCRSMQTGGVDWEARLTAAHHKLSHIETKITRDGVAEPNIGLWSEAEWDFHRTLISACKMPQLQETYDTVYLQFRQQIMGQPRDFQMDYFQAIIIEHAAILEAALKRDETACRSAIFEHLKRNL